MPTALVIEDDPRALRALVEFIERQGFTTATAETFTAAREELRRSQPDVVLLDVYLPDGSGLDLLLEIPAVRRPQVLLMSGQEAVRNALEEMALRTVHFLRKPVEPKVVGELLRRVRRECRSRTSRPSSRPLERLLGSSPAIEEVRGLIARVAPTEVPVYIEGESGTGKELVAEAVRLGSPRADKPFVAINCGALPESLIDSELFGHEKGAFTGANARKRGVFEQADGGTLFLDEVTEMPADRQVRLLRVLESGSLRRVGGTGDVPVDVRIIAASNRPTDQAIDEERIREDLFHRLAVFPIRMPPLRERRADIDPLVERFLVEIAEREGHSKPIEPAALDILRRYPWPGNVRQLSNVVQRAFIVADGIITIESLPSHIRDYAGSTAVVPDPDHPSRLEVPVGTTIADAERALIEATLEDCDGDKQETASTLGISLRTLYNRLKQYAGETEPDLPGEPK